MTRSPIATYSLTNLTLQVFTLSLSTQHKHDLCSHNVILRDTVHSQVIKAAGVRQPQLSHQYLMCWWILVAVSVATPA